jgi:hypothetical protein
LSVSAKYCSFHKQRKPGKVRNWSLYGGEEVKEEKEGNTMALIWRIDLPILGQAGYKTLPLRKIVDLFRLIQAWY